jgi:hypothetical protein
LFTIWILSASATTTNNEIDSNPIRCHHHVSDVARMAAYAALAKREPSSYASLTQNEQINSGDGAGAAMVFVSEWDERVVHW